MGTDGDGSLACDPGVRPGGLAPSLMRWDPRARRCGRRTRRVPDHGHAHHREAAEPEPGRPRAPELRCRPGEPGAAGRRGRGSVQGTRSPELRPPGGGFTSSPTFPELTQELFLLVQRGRERGERNIHDERATGRCLLHSPPWGLCLAWQSHRDLLVHRFIGRCSTREPHRLGYRFLCFLCVF